MISNPFSPIFGGKPEIFFGRKSILQRFDLAMDNQGSDDRALFFTGTRGSGKTALLEQLSMRAAIKNKRVIDLGPEDTIAQLVFELAGSDVTTTTISPQASVSILGVGGGLSAGSVAKTQQASREHLQSLFLNAVKKAKQGILVTVDEVQKVPLDDISSLCNAFQMASRKGHDVMLAVAGLPYARNAIIEHEGCTYLRRAPHEELGLFSWDEANQAFTGVFSSVNKLRVGQALIDRLNEVSYGHPYLMQLLGYHLITYINQTMPKGTYVVTEEDINQAITLALPAYERGALKPLVDALSNIEHEFLCAMARCLDEERLASTAQIAQELKREPRSLSKARAKLIGGGIVAAPEHGKVMFCIPYLADYMLKSNEVSSVIDLARQRRV